MEQKYFKRRLIDILRIMLAGIPMGIGMSGLSIQSHDTGDVFIFVIAFLVGGILVLTLSLHALFRTINDAINAGENVKNDNKQKYWLDPKLGSR